ncbi:MAG: hypothetical protein ACXV8N_14355 [Ilumatobacteraceae bacterium]
MSQPNQEPPPMTMFAPWVECRQERCRGGRVLITAVNHRDGQATYLAPADIDPRSGDRYEATMAELRASGFVATPGDAAPANRGERAVKPAGAGLIWRGADRFVQHCHDAGLRRAFDRSWIAAQIAVAIVGAIAFILTLRTDGLVLRAHPAQIPAIILLGLVAVAIHEFGHALVTVHYGRRVQLVGVRLHLGTPAFYVESVDALLLTRRQRLVQAGAGPWAEWLATSAVAIVFLSLPHDIAGTAILHRFVIVNTIVIASNLLPFVGLDGALLLADAIRQPDLPYRAQSALLAPTGTARNRWLTAYATANMIVAAALVVMACFFWWQLFGKLGHQLWALGPAGVGLVVIAGAALARQVVRMITTTFASVKPQAARLRSKVLFRIERRWRVRAITALRVLPEFGELDEADLGILAGRLQRVCGRGNLNQTLSGHVYVDRLAPRLRRRSATTRLTRGAFGKLDRTHTDAIALGATLVVLPDTWRHFLTQQ